MHRFAPGSLVSMPEIRDSYCFKLFQSDLHDFSEVKGTVYLKTKKKKLPFGTVLEIRKEYNHVGIKGFCIILSDDILVLIFECTAAL